MLHLSLCLPTYNRAVLLTGALGAVLSQVTPAMSGLVEVVVLDNASPDDTPDVVSRAQSEHPHVDLRYIRRPENIGPDANFCDAPNQALGEFVYLLSDDDVLLPGAVQKLLELIEVHPTLDAFALNVREFYHSSEEDNDKGFFKFADDVLTPTRDAALLALGTHITFISCMAFRRLTVAGRDYTDKSATNLAQAYMFVDVLAPGRGLYVTKQPYLAKRADNNEGFDFFRVFVTNFAMLMQYAQQMGYSQEAARQSLINNLDYIIYLVLQFKSRGAIGKIKPNYRDGFIRLWRVYGGKPAKLRFIILMILTPRALFCGLHQLYKRVKTMLFPRTLGQSRSAVQKVQ